MSGMLVLPRRDSDRAKQEEVRDGEKASIKAHKKSGEAAKEDIEQALGLFSSSADTSRHQNF
jgi:hypothetical protein